MKTFAAQIADLAKLVKADMLDVAQGATEDVVSDMQTPKAKGGRLPVDTGYLRNSLASGLNGRFNSDAADGYQMVIAGMDIGDVAQFSYSAEYARRMELGFSGQDSLGRTYEQPGNHFMGTAAAKFPEHVTRRTANIRKRK